MFKGWFITGATRQIAARHAGGRGVRGLGKLPDALQLDADDAHALAAELMEVAIEAFRSKTLMHSDPTRRWSATGGASLKTFFIGRCLMELRRRVREMGPTRTSSAPRRRRSPRCGGRRAAAERLDELFSGTDPLVRTMFELHDQKYTYDEIADSCASEASLNSWAVTSAACDIYAVRGRDRLATCQWGGDPEMG